MDRSPEVWNRRRPKVRWRLVAGAGFGGRPVSGSAVPLVEYLCLNINVIYYSKCDRSVPAAVAAGAARISSVAAAAVAITTTGANWCLGLSVVFGANRRRRFRSRTRCFSSGVSMMLLLLLLLAVLVVTESLVVFERDCMAGGVSRMVIAWS